MPSERISRVSEAIKEEVAMILQQEMKDPRVGFVTITHVKVTNDLRQATVYFSLLEGHGDPVQTEQGLKSAAGFVRRLLGDRLRTRVTPEITFRHDPSVEETIRMSKLLDNVRKEEDKQVSD